MEVQSDINSDHSSDERHDSGAATKRRKIGQNTNPSPGFQSTFQCMYKHDGEDNHDNPNARTIQVVGGQFSPCRRCTTDRSLRSSYLKCKNTIR